MQNILKKNKFPRVSTKWNQPEIVRIFCNSIEHLKLKSFSQIFLITKTSTKQQMKSREITHLFDIERMTNSKLQKPHHKFLLKKEIFLKKFYLNFFFFETEQKKLPFSISTIFFFFNFIIFFLLYFHYKKKN